MTYNVALYTVLMFVPIIRNSVTYLKMASWKLLIQLIHKKKTHVIIRFLNVYEIAIHNATGGGS